MPRKALLPVLMLLLAASALRAQTRPVGLFQYDSTRAWNGYTLLAPKQYTSTYLLNNAARQLNRWSRSRYQAKEVLGGFNLIEADSMEEAVRIASGFPWAQTGCVEVRAVRDLNEVRASVGAIRATAKA